MAKKSGGSSKQIDIVDLFAYIAIVFSAVIFLINAILKACNANLGNVMNIMTLIKDIAVVVALGFGAYSFARRRGIIIKIFFAIAIITYVVCLILGVAL